MWGGAKQEPVPVPGPGPVDVAGPIDLTEEAEGAVSSMRERLMVEHRLRMKAQMAEHR